MLLCTKLVENKPRGMKLYSLANILMGTETAFIFHVTQDLFNLPVSNDGLESSHRQHMHRLFLKKILTMGGFPIL